MKNREIRDGKETIYDYDPKPHHLKPDWDAADTTNKKLDIIAKALGIV